MSWEWLNGLAILSIKNGLQENINSDNIINDLYLETLLQLISNELLDCY